MNGNTTGGESPAAMNDPKRRFFSGDTLQQALVQAANHFNLLPEEIAYRPVEKRHGFLKVRRKVVIEVDAAAPRREAPVAPAPAAAAQARFASGGGAAAPLPPATERRSWSEELGAPAPGRPPAAPGEEPRAPRPEPAERPAEIGLAVGVEVTPPSAGPARPAAPPARRDSGADPGRRARSRSGSGGSEPAAAAATGAVAEEDDDNLGNIGNKASAPRQGQGRGQGRGLVALPERPRSTAERFPEATGPQAEAAARGLELLLRIGGLNLKPRIYQGEDRLEIDLVGPDTDWCFADDGEFLMSIEHLLPRVIRSLSGEGVLCRVDCDNFHEIREERLRTLAQRVADEVRQRGRARTLVPMNPADRRIVHVTLADDPAVVTESEGDGYFKRITVRPA
jgi:spoIIIJ-associated protein